MIWQLYNMYIYIYVYVHIIRTHTHTHMYIIYPGLRSGPGPAACRDPAAETPFWIHPILH